MTWPRSYRCKWLGPGLLDPFSLPWGLLVLPLESAVFPRLPSMGQVGARGRRGWGGSRPM